jgi:hypothetical protein
MARRRTPSTLLLLALSATLAFDCAPHRYYPPPPPDPEPAAPVSAAPATSTLPPPDTQPPAPAPEVEDPLAVQAVREPIVVHVWAEPRQLPAGGGVTHILVRVHGSRGSVLPGVEVRLATSEGSLFSNGRVLVTDARGMTRDRLTASRSATITLNVGGQRRVIDVPAVPPGQPRPSG